MAPRHSLLPSFLYAPSAGGNGGSEPPFGKIEMFSPAYYSACAFSGAAACGVTHAAVTPLDVIKCNIQVRVCRALRAARDIGFLELVVAVFASGYYYYIPGTFLFIGP
jgi:hypothetical protein